MAGLYSAGRVPTRWRGRRRRQRQKRAKPGGKRTPHRSPPQSRRLRGWGDHAGFRPRSVIFRRVCASQRAQSAPRVRRRRRSSRPLPLPSPPRPPPLSFCRPPLRNVPTHEPLGLRCRVPANARPVAPGVHRISVAESASRWSTTHPPRPIGDQVKETKKKTKNPIYYFKIDERPEPSNSGW